VFKFPATLYRTFGHWTIYPLVLLTLLCIIPISRIEVASGFTLLLPEQDEYRIQQTRVRETFGTSESIILAMDVPELFRAEDLARIALIEEVAAQVPGTAYVLGLATMPDLLLDDNTLETVPLYNPEADPDLQVLTERVLGTPLFQEFFVSADGKALLTYVVPEDDVKPTLYVEQLMETLGEDGLRYFGDAVVETLVSHTVSRELVILGALALLVIMVIEMLIARSVIVGVVLTLVSAVPAIWTLALFPLLGQAVETTTMMVPVIVLVLATSYGVHLFRYHASHGANTLDTLEQVSKVVISAGVTTMVGFLSLVVTPSELLRQLGWLIIFGILTALLSSLLLFPPILARLPIRKRKRPRTIERRANGSGFKGRFGILWMLTREPKRPGVRLIVVLLVLLPFALSIPSIRAGFSSRDTFRPGSKVAQTVEYFVERSQSNQQIEIVIDTGYEYGLVDPENYYALKEFETSLLQDEAISGVTSYMDFVEWMNGRLQGTIDTVLPESDAEIGESMELLSGEGVEDLFEALVDFEWRQARFTMRASLPNLSSPVGSVAIEDLSARIDRYRELLPEEFEVSVLGEPFANLRYAEYLGRSQYISLLMFMPILLAFLLLVFRSLGWALITLIPTFVGVVIYFGIVSILGFLHDPGHVFMVAALMGVSNDDVLYFVVIFKDKSRLLSYARTLKQTMSRTGVAILQTTLIITAGIAVFFFSESGLLARAGLVAIISLWAASLTTLLALPAVIKLLPAMRKKQSEIERQLA
jgi:predicted RND superfamily exporter protein